MRNEPLIPRFRRAFLQNTHLRSYSPAAKASFAFIALFVLWFLTSSRGVRFDASSNAVYNGTLGFEDLFVISLPTRPDRRDAMSLLTAVTGLQFKWIDGVAGESVPEKALPPGIASSFKKGAIGSWRAHMNAIRSIVERNLTSALILEDDADWDIRLKSQFATFAKASRLFLRQVPQNRGVHSDNIDIHLPEYVDPSNSGCPYGDDWDVLFLGHCGVDFPSSSTPKLPQSRVIISGDETVPIPKHLRPHPFANPDILGELYPPHTRAVHHPVGGICSFAYAVSQKGAQKILYEFGIRGFTEQYDVALGKFCDGTLANAPSGKPSSEGSDHSMLPNCVTVQPTLFSHRYGKEVSSDIEVQGGGYINREETKYIRWSTRMNLGTLVQGKTDFVDQWPD